MSGGYVTSVDVRRILGRNATVAWRWLRVVGYERESLAWPYLVRERDAVAIYAGHRHGRTELGRLMARSIARTSYAWLLVALAPTCPVVLGANTAEELLRLWRQAGSPPATVLNVDRLTAEVLALLEPIPCKPNETGVPIP